ncbi:MAG: GntR family transcriptional regulator [Chloroflexota bacterium]
MTRVNRHSSIPLYEQIKNILRDQIVNGTLAQGELMPTEHELCALFGVSRITVVRALNELATAGFVVRVQGKGTTVNNHRIDENLNDIQGFSRTMESQGLKVVSKVISIEDFEGDAATRQIFGLHTDDTEGFTRIRRLRSVNGVTAVIFNTTVRRHVGDKLRQYVLDDVSIYSLYREVLGVHVAASDVTLVPVVATPEMIHHFGVEPGTAHFWLQSVSYLEDGQPIETTAACYRGDLFQFKSRLQAMEQDRPKDPWFINPAMISDLL